MNLATNALPAVESAPAATNGPGWFTTVRQDFLASIVVFLVALPLCMGIAIASGAPVASGLITGIIGGLVVGSLAGSPLQVSGPAAGLTVIVYDLIQRYGLECLGWMVLGAGALQVAAGLLRLGQWFRAVSPAVIQGMLAGIGVLIFASQFHVMVDDQPKGSGIQNLLTLPEAVWKGLEVPNLKSREVRRIRTSMLRDVGELHRRQVHLSDQVSGSAAARLVRSDDPEAAAVSAELERLTEQQQRVTQQTSEVVAALQALERKISEGTKSETILAAAAQAAEKTEAALQVLQRQDIAAVVESQHEAVASLEALLRRLKNHSIAAELGLLTIALIVLWQSVVPRKLRVIPAPLTAVVVVTALAAALTLPVVYVEVPDSLFEEVRWPAWTVLQGASWSGLVGAAVLLAAVASAETLLCATAVDQMHNGPRTRYDRELIAQGTGNMLCGLAGALPMTGVIVRSSANVQAGARTRLSAILHGAWLLVFVAFFAFLLRLIPTASLAAILVYTGYKLVNPKSIMKLYSYGWGEVGIYAATVVMIVVTDLLTGVLVGIALAAAKLLYTFSHLSTRLELRPEKGQAVLRLSGVATFIRLPQLAAELERVPPSVELHVDFEHLDYVDHACLDLLMNWAKQHEATGGRLVIDWESLHANFRRNGGNARNQISKSA